MLVLTRARQRVLPHADWIVGAALFLLSGSIYLRTLAPSVAFIFDDSLEFQLLAWRMAIAHPTGYPLYSILIKLFSFIPIGDIAYRLNLASAFFGALAVALIYFAARQLVESRAAALLGALVFALSETFWSQAVVAEVYTLQALLTALMLWLALRWGKKRLPPPLPSPVLRGSGKKGVSLLSLSFFFGLMLTHHRMSILLLPALAIYVLSYDRSFLREPRTRLRMAVAFALPLLLYLYIPLRGLSTSSLDGAYQNTTAGFLNWVLGSSYTVFLTQNPFNQNRAAAFYLELFLNQFTPIGFLLAAIGFIYLLRVARREWILLALGWVANLAFAITYRVSDVNVFFIPAFLFTALFLACGVDAMVRILSRARSRQEVPPVRLYLVRGAALMLVLLLFYIPYALLRGNFFRVELSDKWDVHDYGRDILAQNLPPDSTLIGILGEMTLVRYFQETQNLRADVETVAADKEPARLAAIDRALKNNRTVFLTRLLADVEKKYSLASFGPLVQVQLKPNKTNAPSPTHALGEDFDDVKLLGYDLDLSRLNDSTMWHLENGRRARVTLYWRVENKIANDRFVSLKLLMPDGTRGGQLDRRPVLDSYPTTAWRVGEYITDVYDLPIFVGAAPGEYTLNVAFYDPDSGNVHGQKDLEKIALAPDTHDHFREALGVQQTAFYDFGGIELIGFSLDGSDAYAPSMPVAMTLLWRVPDVDAHDFEIELLDAAKGIAHSQITSVGYRAQIGTQYLRQELSLVLPSNLPMGNYQLRLSPRNSRCALPPLASCYELGSIQVTAK